MVEYIIHYIWLNHKRLFVDDNYREANDNHGKTLINSCSFLSGITSVNYSILS